MKKAATLNLRVNPTVKEMAEEILSRLGLPMSTAINMYLNQIILTGGIPFAVSLPKAPDSINADLMSKEEIIKRLEKGIQDSESGKIQNTDNAFRNLSAKLNLWKKYSVQITKAALDDIESIYIYIAEKLLSPENAIRQYNRLKEAILKLDTFPERYNILNIGSELHHQIRRMPVDNYSAFYIVKDNTVVIIDVLYSSSNIENILDHQV